MHLTLFVPQLLWPEPDDRQTLDPLALPGLEWLFARGQYRQMPRRSNESGLADCFGLTTTAYAPLRRLGESDGTTADVDEGFWLCADPVHLRLYNEQIILADAASFETTLDEARELAAALSEAFAETGSFHAATPQRWYLRLKAPVDHVAEPISVVASRRLHGDLSGKTSPLYRWLNEVQMFLFAHPVNSRRQSRGQPAINSLWLWGGGQLPAVSGNGLDTLHSDDPLARGLGRRAGLPCLARPDNLDSVLNQQSGHHLVVLDQLQDTALHEQGDGWHQAMSELDERWFTPARQQLGKRLRALTLIAPTIYGDLCWTVSPADRWKLWRRPRPLPGLIRQIAQGGPA